MSKIQCPSPLTLILAAGFALSPAAVFAQNSTEPSRNLAEQGSSEATYDQYMRLGYAAQQRGDYRTAAYYFRNALYTVPNDQEATIAYWNAFGQLQNDSGESRRSFDAYMNSGYDATEQGDYAAALSNFRQALQLRPGDYYATQAIRNVETYLNRGDSAGLSRPTPSAYNITYPGELPYDRYMRLGYAAAQREDFRTAIDHFRSALYERPNDRQATIAYWNAVDATNDGEFGLGGESPESDYDRYMRLGYDATERGDYSRALSFFENALGARPNDAYATQAIRNVRTYINRGEALTSGSSETTN